MQKRELPEIFVQLTGYHRRYAMWLLMDLTRKDGDNKLGWLIFGQLPLQNPVDWRTPRWSGAALDCRSILNTQKSLVALDADFGTAADGHIPS